MYAEMIFFLGVILKETTVTFPANKEEILEKIENTLQTGTRLACFGHIPSNYPVIMPVEEIVKLCHSKGVPVLIDGAHALGSLPLNLTGLEADYYVANAHKWLACPKVLCNVVCCFLFPVVKIVVHVGQRVCKTKAKNTAHEIKRIAKFEITVATAVCVRYLGCLKISKVLYFSPNKLYKFFFVYFNFQMLCSRIPLF